MVLTDPPYNISRPNNFSTMGREGFSWTWDAGFDNRRLVTLCARLLARGGSLVYFTDWKLLGDLAAVAASCGLVEKDPLTLRKPSPQPRNINRRYVSDREFAFWAVEPSAPWAFRPPESGYRRPEFNYSPPRGAQRSHPTEKPLGLFEELIANHSAPGDLVLDPCMGAGTTAVAAQRTGRRFVGVEVQEDYYRAATLRLA